MPLENLDMVAKYICMHTATVTEFTFILMYMTARLNSTKARTMVFGWARGRCLLA